MYYTTDGANWQENGTFVIEWDGSKYVTSTSYTIRLDNDTLTIGNSTYVQSLTDPGTDFTGTWLGPAGGTTQYKLVISGRTMNVVGALSSNPSNWTTIYSNVSINWTGINYLTSAPFSVISRNGATVTFMLDTYNSQP